MFYNERMFELISDLTTMEKLQILADAAKYDVACTSSGVDRKGKEGFLGNSVACGVCHSFGTDGRCISLLKVLMTNHCVYDCKYCMNRCSNDVPRATFEPDELCQLVIEFYKRNYIEGLFLSSAVIGTPDYTMERMIEVLRILRQEYHFNGYIHAKTIPGADAELVRRIGLLADRLSVNIELPSEASLSLLAPDKKKQAILKPMGQIAVQSAQSKKELVLYRHAPAFAPAGQSTQMIIGATPESDRHIMGLAESLYKKYSLKRVFFSAYLPVNSDSRLPALDVRPPLLREHRLYQADFLLRFYQFKADEIQKTIDEYTQEKEEKQLLIEHYQKLMQIDGSEDYSDDIESLKEDLTIADTYIKEQNEKMKDYCLIAEKDGTYYEYNKETGKFEEMKE